VPEPILDETGEALLAGGRRAVLTTLDARDRRPRSVPICFAVGWEFGDPIIYSALDEKPKASSNLGRLTRVRNLETDPRATILVDRWDEDWSRLAFVELECRGSLLEPAGGGADRGNDDGAEHRRAISLLRAKYPQYAEQRIEDRPVLRFSVIRAVSWRAASR
jgi:PPOX class probable F420-dependent enzyme